jgi:hydrogenase nickel incorporation protein HypA/HybF
MHEFGIAQSMLDLAIETAKKNNASKILSIKVRIGELSHVTLDSLSFAFSCVSQGSIAEGAKLSASQIKGSDAIEIESIEVD